MRGWLGEEVNAEKTARVGQGGIERQEKNQDPSIHVHDPFLDIAIFTSSVIVKSILAFNPISAFNPIDVKTGAEYTGLEGVQVYLVNSENGRAVVLYAQPLEGPTKATRLAYSVYFLCLSSHGCLILTLFRNCQGFHQYSSKHAISHRAGFFY